MVQNYRTVYIPISLNHLNKFKFVCLYLAVKINVVTSRNIFRNIPPPSCCPEQSTIGMLFATTAVSLQNVNMQNFL
jgi:hypothetical protein